ncbi:MAG: CHAT domain-containing protein [Firmicutes bacterium]|jgi:CHAT domain-containing protein/tetratricopeptide (TPR) repeat protein|nr:CHAT domain-containing protein [Bacillota bacterium]
MATYSREEELERLLSEGRAREVLVLASELEAQYRAAGDKPGVAAAQLVVAQAYSQLSQFDEAISSYRTAQRVFQSIGSAEQAARADMGLGDVFLARTDYSSAFECYSKAGTAFRALGLVRDLLMSRLREAQALMFSGDFDRSLSLAIECRQNALDARDDAAVAKADKIRGTVLWYQDEYQSALTALEQARSRFNALGMVKDAAACDNNMALIYWKLNLHQEALDLFVRARGAMAAAGMRMEAATVDLNIGLVSMSMRNYEDALTHLESSDAVFRELGVRAKSAWARYYRAKIHLELGQPEEALTLLDAAREVFEAQGVEVYYRQVDILRARALFDLGRHEEALSLYEASLECGIRHKVPDMIFPSLYGRGCVLARCLPEQAYREFEASIDEIEGIRLGLDRDRLKTGFVSDKMQVYDAMISLCLRTGRIRSALDYVDRAKAQSMRDLMACGRMHGHDIRLGSLERLTADGALIEYWVSGDRVIVFALTADDLFVHDDPTAARSLAQAAAWVSHDMWIMETSTPDFIRRNLSQLVSSFQEHSRCLYETLFAPLRCRLPGVSRLFIVPHGPLHYLPFHALFDGSRYLADSYEVCYGPSGRILSSCMASEKRAMRSCLVVGVPGDDLPFVQAECEAVAKCFGEASLVLSGEEATRERVLNSCGSFDVIHLAGHGAFRGDNPMFSGIALHDSDITASDVMGLALSASLVTLSACDSGRARVLSGDEHLGFVRGFFQAGVSSLVVSLWKVNDESASMLVGRFYEGVRAGLPVGKSLRSAELSVKEELSHPYYWAPFVLIGDPG